MTIELSEYVIDAIADAVVKKMQVPCNDAISRQVINEVKELMTDINGHTVYAVKMSDIRQLPSVTPREPKTGHWIRMPIGFKCSDCGELEDETTKYCPNCGSYNGAEEKESEE